MTQTLHLRLATTESTIPYLCGVNVWNDAAAYVREHFSKRAVIIITDETVKDLYHEQLTALFGELPRYQGILTIPAGEASKSRTVKDALEDAMFERGMGRDSAIIAVGGGVVGDVAGYVAATFQRGVPLVHLPTTLLAQVDSSIGGKTGINHTTGKNLLGAFYQPAAIFADILTLGTLSEEEFYNGMAEVLKYAASLDYELWQYLENNEAAIKRREADALAHIITRSAALKIGVVEKDEKESGLRAILNFGHTAGHAFELLSHYQIPHGFAVAAGMRVAMRLSRDLCGYSDEYVSRFDALLERFHLKNDYSHRFSREAIWHAMTMDKKSRAGAPKFVLLKNEGAKADANTHEYALAVDVDRAAFDAALDASIFTNPAPRLCVSVMPQYATDIAALLQKTDGADIIELRVDMMPLEELHQINWAYVRANAPKPLLITCRSRDEGGYFVGTDADRLEMYQAAIVAGVEWIDVEFANAAEILPMLPIGLETKVVLSHHILSGGMLETALRDKLDEMTNVYADVYKLIFTADDVSSSLVAVNVLEYAKSRFLNVVIHAMGEFGEPSRLMGAVRGNEWTYTALSADSTTAVGQITQHEAKNVYFLPEKSSPTSIYGLVGFPTRQSKGKYLHNALYNLLPNKRNLLYMNFPTPEVGPFWRGWKDMLSGLSVTIPHKEAIFRLLDEVSDEAKLSGVCNTAVPVNGRWKGFNTDVLALEDCLRDYSTELQFGTLIIGTGATTQSAITALRRLGVSNNSIFVIGRNRARVSSVTSKFKVRGITESEYGSLDVGAIIQTTSVGMTPHVDEMPYGSELFRRGMVVMDVVYNPIRTKYIQTAEFEKCITITGDEMFIRQAAHQFRLFTGVDVPLDEVRRVWMGIA
jgi:3-dehydroquinate synthase